MKNESLIQLFERYYWLLADTKRPLPLQDKCDREHLMWLCYTAIDGIKNESMPYGKLCRWLGFIQGILCVANITTVDEERDFTRPIFKGEPNVQERE